MDLIDSFWFAAFTALLISLNFWISRITEYVANKSPGLKLQNQQMCSWINLKSIIHALKFSSLTCCIFHPANGICIKNAFFLGFPLFASFVCAFLPIECGGSMWACSSLHWLILLSNCSFSYNGVYWINLLLSI